MVLCCSVLPDQDGLCAWPLQLLRHGRECVLGHHLEVVFLVECCTLVLKSSSLVSVLSVLIGRNNLMHMGEGGKVQAKMRDAAKKQAHPRDEWSNSEVSFHLLHLDPRTKPREIVLGLEVSLLTASHSHICSVLLRAGVCCLHAGCQPVLTAADLAEASNSREFDWIPSVFV